MRNTLYFSIEMVRRITRVLRLQTHKCRPLSSPSDSLPTVRETRIVPLGVTSRNVFSIGQIPSFLSRLRSINYLWYDQCSTSITLFHWECMM